MGAEQCPASPPPGLPLSPRPQVPKGLHLYEAKLDAAKRIVWEVALAFSERRSQGAGGEPVFAEVQKGSTCGQKGGPGQFFFFWGGGAMHAICFDS